MTPLPITFVTGWMNVLVGVNKCASQTVKLQTNLLCLSTPWLGSEDAVDKDSLSSEAVCVPRVRARELCGCVCNKYACLQSRQELLRWGSCGFPSLPPPSVFRAGKSRGQGTWPGGEQGPGDSRGPGLTWCRAVSPSSLHKSGLTLFFRK